MAELNEEIARWEARLRREKEARRQAERLLEEKSLALYQQNEQLRDLTENLEKVVEQRTAELAEALKEAQSANVAKREFFANISHELRTPLNGILGMTQLLRDSGLNQLQDDYVRIILVSSEILLNLISDILDFSKIEAGKLELEQIDFDLEQTVDEVLDILSVRGNEKKLDLFADTSRIHIPHLTGDPYKLKQVLINLFSNAIKFTERGQVVLTVQLLNETENVVIYRFDVQDSGIGIPPEKLKQLFNPFIQADASTSRKFGGTGLGLTISRKLVELMGGEVGVESTIGQGSRFWFTARFLKQKEVVQQRHFGQSLFSGFSLCLYEQNPVLRQYLTDLFISWGMHVRLLDTDNNAVANEHEIVVLGPFDEASWLEEAPVNDLSKYKHRILLSKEKSSAVTRMAFDRGIDRILFKPLRHADLFEQFCRLLEVEEDKPIIVETNTELVANQENSSFRVLVVEDNPINQKVALSLLNKLGYRADTAANGVIALQRMQEQEYDLLLMDFQMPEMDGPEASMRIRAGQSGINRMDIPIVAMTANAMKTDRERCEEAGMDDFLAKPLLLDELARVMQRWHQRSEAKS